MRKLFQRFVLIAVMLSVGFGTHAANIRAVTELFSPFQFYDDAGSLAGCTTEVVRKLAEANGDALTIDVMPWSMAYQVALTNPGTLIFSIGRNEQREPLFHWIGELTREQLYFWALSSSKIPQGSTLSDFSQYRIAVVKDATTHQYLDSHGFENLYLMSATESNIDESTRVRMLMKGRADVMIATSVHIQNAISELRMPKNTLKAVYRAIELDTNLSIAISAPADPELVARYQQTFLQMNVAERMQQCVSEW